MKILEVKEKLISQIGQLENANLLGELLEILTDKSAEKVELTKEQIIAVAEARAQYNRGDIASDEEVRMQFDKWLREK